MEIARKDLIRMAVSNYENYKKTIMGMNPDYAQKTKEWNEVQKLITPDSAVYKYADSKGLKSGD